MDIVPKIILFFYGSLFVLLVLSTISGFVNGETIEGNKVYVDTNQGYLSAEPHHMTNDGYVYSTLISKQFSGSANAVFGFDSENALPSSIDLKKNHTVNVTYFYSSNDSNNITTYWNETVGENREWLNINKQFTKVDRDLDGKDLWYYIDDFQVIQDEPIEFRFYLDLKGGDGKYDIAVYPSSYGANLIQAYNNNHMILLDPTFNYSSDDGSCDSSYIVGVGNAFVKRFPNVNLTGLESIDICNWEIASSSTSWIYDMILGVEGINSYTNNGTYVSFSSNHSNLGTGQWLCENVTNLDNFSTLTGNHNLTLKMVGRPNARTCRDTTAAESGGYQSWLKDPGWSDQSANWRWMLRLEVSLAESGGGSTCDCSSIQAGTTIDCSENCDIEACDASTEDITFSGTGSISISGDITNFGDITIQGTDASNKCIVTCNGGCFLE